MKAKSLLGDDYQCDYLHLSFVEQDNVVEEKGDLARVDAVFERDLVLDEDPPGCGGLPSLSLSAVVVHDSLEGPLVLLLSPRGLEMKVLTKEACGRRCLP